MRRGSTVWEEPRRAHVPVDTGLHQIEADHRVANSLRIAAAVLTQEQRRIVDLGQAKATLAAAARLSAIVRLHRTLCATASREEVDLGVFLTALRDDIGDSVGVTPASDADRVALPAAAAVQVGIVVNEMAINAVKHAARDRRPPVLTVEANRNGLGEVRLRLHDDGPGFPEEFKLGRDRGIGLTVMTATVERPGEYVYATPRFDLYLAAGVGLEIVLAPQGWHPRSVDGGR